MWKKRYPGFAAILLATSIISGAFAGLNRSLPPSPQIPLSCSTAEQCFALGIPLPLKDADEFAFQLIPKVGDSVSTSLMEKNEAICALANKLPTAEGWRAFLVAKGVGPTLAKELGRFFQVSPLSACLRGQGTRLGIF